MIRFTHEKLLSILFKFILKVGRLVGQNLMATQRPKAHTTAPLAATIRMVAM
jgi:hypothetical protein